ncbi:Fumitremorgin C synthase [Madurella mycetomatis]|uniref:Fumitremorgin C synthase n=1 Tax=Madurella mycetomatis TaxID=100816 RepID=A0A175WG75_9PEZI|nr:Fumitremorgin C synthase [Madurella mycetomatis]
MHTIILWFLGVVIFGAAITQFIKVFRRLNDPKGPPGPTLIPYIGRVHDLPIQFMWLKFKEWADKYGSGGFYRTEMLGAKFLIITDEKIAEDLLVRRAKYNSDRPQIQSLFDSKSSCGSMEYLPLMGRNEYWARQRKLTHAYLTGAASARYYGVMYFEAKRWLARLIQHPDNFQNSLEDMSSKIMCQLTWDDPSVSEALTKSAWGLLTQMSPAGPITNVLTPLWHLPYYLNPWKIAERKRHDEQQAWWMERLLVSKARLRKGELRHCWTRQFLEKTALKTSISGDYEASCVLGMLALVGIITVAGPLSYWLVAMVHHPEWQEAVQREVDEMCGGRLPTIEDAPKLPILRACIKETMRWRPNLPTGVAHEAEIDDVYNGCFIPKGTRLLPLDWAFLRNPEKYPDPENFRPERWLEPGWPTYQEPLTRYPTIKGMTSFGWGQRQCLGQSVTQDELIVACGALAWCFNLKRKRDTTTGNDLPVPLDKCNSLLLIKPDPFQMKFEPRSQDPPERAYESPYKADDTNPVEQHARSSTVPPLSFRINQNAKTPLIIGATGKQGGAVIDALLSLDPTRARFTTPAVTRDTASPAAQRRMAKLPTSYNNIQLIQADLVDAPEAGCDLGRFSIQPSLGPGISPDREIAQGTPLIDCTVSAGVEHLIYSSVERGGDDRSWSNPTPAPHSQTKYHIERHLHDATSPGKPGAGVGWTILRPAAFKDNLTPEFRTSIFLAVMRNYLGEDGKTPQWVATVDIGYIRGQGIYESRGVKGEGRWFGGGRIIICADEWHL